jgi:two-component system, chemotaxis family, sensor kinase CheA
MTPKSADPYRYFRVEAREIHDALSSAALAFERRGPLRDEAADALRRAHTLKGAARVVRLPEIADLAHRVEDVLAPLRDAPPVPRPDVARALIALLDAIDAALARLPSPSTPASDASGTATPPREADGRDNLAVAAAAPGATERADAALAETERSLDRWSSVGAVLTRIGAAQETLLRRLGGDPEALAIAADARDEARRAARAFDDLATRAKREAAAARDAVRSLRLVSARALAAPLERAARDAAAETGKAARFETRGLDERVDAALLAAVEAPLQHLVRNAVAHGLETAAARRELGKPETGLVEISVRREGGRVLFRCRDDGRGLDFDRLRATIAERDGLDAAAAAALNDGTIVRRLLLGGVSTSARASQISGRGVGLDVARDAAKRLGGDVSIESEPGRGAAVTLRVPSDVAALDAFVVESGGAACALPASRVVSASSAAEAAARGANASIADILGVDVDSESPAPRFAIVLSSDDGEQAVLVDAAPGRATVAFTPYGRRARAEGPVTGSAPRPDGAPVLVLDADAVVRAARSTPPRRKPAPRPPARVLVVDDSLTTRMLETAVLEAAGHEVVAVDSAEAALDALAAGRFDVVLADVEMPGADGFELLRRAKARAGPPAPPFVMVTSRDGEDDRRRAAESGARGYLCKRDFDQKVLLETVRRLAAEGRT